MTKLDAELLLESHSIAELQTILVNIKADADKKKYELRRLVGDSYRDVIDAADTITAMKETAIELISLFDECNKYCNVELNIDEEAVADSSLKETRLMIMAQIRLLMLTPEQVWNALEARRFLVAARLYIIAEFVYQKLDGLSGDASVKIRNLFPVYKRQWEVIKPLRTQIIDTVVEGLKRVIITKDDVYQALACLSIIENRNLPDLFRTFLQYRKSVILGNLVIHESNGELTDIVSNTPKCIVNTLNIIYEIFYSENEVCAFEQFLHNVDSQGLGPLSQLYDENTNINLLLEYLPSNLKECTKSKINLAIPLGQRLVSSACESWLVGIQQPIQERLLLLFQRIESESELVQLLEILINHLLEISIDTQENSAKHTLFNNLYTSWTFLFHKVVAKRADQIASSSFSTFFKEADEQLNNFLQSADGIYSIGVGEQIWKQQLKQSADPIYDDSKAVVNLELHEIATVTGKLFTTARQVFKDLSRILNFQNDLEEKLSPHIKGETEKFYVAIQNYIVAAISKHCNKLENLLNVVGKEKDERLIIMKSMLIGSVSSSVAGCLPLLLQLFKETVLVNNLKPIIFESSLNDLQQTFTDVYVKGHDRWIAVVTKNFNSGMGKYVLEMQNSNFDIVASFPSSGVFKLLQNICKEIYQMEGFNISEVCVGKLRISLLTAIDKIFGQILDSSVLNSQHLFDYHYLYLSLSGSIADNPMQQKLEKCFLDSNTLFDIDEMILAVKKWNFKSSGLFGLLFTEKLAKNESRTSVSEKHHMIQLADSVPRFNLIPVSVPNRNDKRSSLIKRDSGNFSKTKLKPLASIKLEETKISITGAMRDRSNNEIRKIKETSSHGSDLFSSATNFLSGYWGSSSISPVTPKSKK